MKTAVLSIFILTMVVLSACAPQEGISGGGATSAAGGTSSDGNVNISGFAFEPASVTIKVGGTVTWINKDGVVHTVVADDKSWSSDNLSKGGQYSHKFEAAGTFTYTCGVHPNMKGTVIVKP